MAILNQPLNGVGDLQLIPPGWFDGDGREIDKSGLLWLEQLLESYPEDLPKFYIYPTPNGDIQLEWDLNPHEPELVINLLTHSANWFDLNLETHEFITKELNLDKDWNWVISAIEACVS